MVRASLNLATSNHPYKWPVFDSEMDHLDGSPWEHTADTDSDSASSDGDTDVDGDTDADSDTDGDSETVADTGLDIGSPSDSDLDRDTDNGSKTDQVDDDTYLTIEGDTNTASNPGNEESSSNSTSSGCSCQTLGRSPGIDLLPALIRSVMLL